MSDEQVDSGTDEQQQDTRVDLWVTVVVFCTATLMAIHFVSGFSFDF